jgi:hypothetical protein
MAGGTIPLNLTEPAPPRAAQSLLSYGCRFGSSRSYNVTARRYIRSASARSLFASAAAPGYSYPSVTK